MLSKSVKFVLFLQLVVGWTAHANVLRVDIYDDPVLTSSIPREMTTLNGGNAPVSSTVSSRWESAPQNPSNFEEFGNATIDVFPRFLEVCESTFSRRMSARPTNFKKAALLVTDTYLQPDEALGMLALIAHASTQHGEESPNTVVIFTLPPDESMEADVFAMIDSLMGTLAGAQYQMCGIWKFRQEGQEERWTHHFTPLYQRLGQPAANREQAALDAQAYIDVFKIALLPKWDLKLDSEEEEVVEY